MRKRIILAIIFFLLSGLAFVSLYYFLEIRQQFSALQVTSTPKAQIYLNGELLGTTPLLRDKLKPGEYTLKIVAEGGQVFEQKIKLSPSLLTVVDRTLRENEAQSEGSLLTLETISDKNKAELLVLSAPSEAKVSLDNEPRGVTPFHLKDVTVSDHEIFLTSPGFVDKRVRVKTSTGYKLVANVRLALLSEEAKLTSPSPTPSITSTPPIPMVKIKQTPTGFLRVRFSPSLVASEVARVKPGESFPLLEETTDWTKISLVDGTSGWVSNLYIIKP